MTILQKLKTTIKLTIQKAINASILAFSPPIRISSSSSPIYIYHGNLFRSEYQYKIPAFYGLALERNNPRDLLVASNGKIPIEDEIVDAFQSQDVLEHLDPEILIDTLNEIYRILKPNGFFRLSVPDYRSPLLLKRTIFNHKGEALGDAGMGAIAFTADLNSELQIKHGPSLGDITSGFQLTKKYKNI